MRESVGRVLCHDITRIVPGEFKGPAFRKGHIIAPEDIPELLKLGKENVYVWEDVPGGVHENQAALRLAAAAAGGNIRVLEPVEGRANLAAACRGVLKVKVPVLRRINTLGSTAVATLHTNRLVGEGTMVAGAKVIPLVIGEEELGEAEKTCREAGGLVEVLPLRLKSAGLVISGSEVFTGHVPDGFGPIVRRKLEALGAQVAAALVVPDDTGRIAGAVREMLDRGVDLVLVTGGMSVDPDDLTPAAVKSLANRVVTYGTPAFPGAMFLLAYAGVSGQVPVLGLPGCVLHAPTTVLDLVLPRILAGEILDGEDFADLGHGGLCQGCSQCFFPRCAFGKGS